MSLFNIIIVGPACNDLKIIKSGNNIDNWNNINQADHCALLVLNTKYENRINITCYDQEYIKDYSESNIVYIKKFFSLECLKQDQINIIIDFTNKSYTECLDKNFNIAIIACSCAWDKGFPIDIIDYIVNNDLYYKPITHDYNIPYNITQIIKNIPYMLPYSIALCELFGPVLYISTRIFNQTLGISVDIDIAKCYENIRNILLNNVIINSNKITINNNEYESNELVEFIGGDDLSYRKITYKIRLEINYLIYNIYDINYPTRQLIDF